MNSYYKQAAFCFTRLYIDGLKFIIFIHLADYLSKATYTEEYNKQYIIKRQTDTGSACNSNF